MLPGNRLDTEELSVTATRPSMNNPSANFNYLLGCASYRQAILIDPFDAELMLKTAAEHQLDIKMIINTHEHFDHVMGNEGIQDATSAEVWAQAEAGVPRSEERRVGKDCGSR